MQGNSTDNTNINFMFLDEEFNPKNNHIMCFAHILNLDVRGFMKILDSELEKTDNTLNEIDEDDNKMMEE